MSAENMKAPAEVGARYTLGKSKHCPDFDDTIYLWDNSTMVAVFEAPNLDPKFCSDAVASRNLAIVKLNAYDTLTARLAEAEELLQACEDDWQGQLTDTEANTLANKRRAFLNREPKP